MSEVKATTDYSIFKTMAGNREVNEQHVKRLMRTITQNNLTNKFPIVVNSNMEVVDGQHRLEALERLELPVPYRLEDEIAIEDVRILNQTSRHWNWQDLARSYVELGNTNYQILLDLNAERPSLLNIETLLKIANVNFAKSNYNPRPNYFFGGGLVFDDEQKKDLTKCTRQLADFADTQPHLKALGNNSRELPRTYVAGMIRVMKSETYNHREFLQRLSTSHTMLLPVVDVNEALRELEKAYNKNLGENSRVRLF